MPTTTDQGEEIAITPAAPWPMWWKMTVFEWLPCLALFIGLATLAAVFIYSSGGDNINKTTLKYCGWAFLVEMGCAGLSCVSLLGIRKRRWKRLVGLALIGMMLTTASGMFFLLIGLSAGMIC